MTPQQRHIEAARTIVRPMLASYHVSPKLNQPSFDPYESIARAIAEAENRVAWQVWGKCATLCDIDKTMREISEDYGPRPEVE